MGCACSHAVKYELLENDIKLKVRDHPPPKGAPPPVVGAVRDANGEWHVFACCGGVAKGALGRLPDLLEPLPTHMEGIVSVIHCQNKCV